MTSHVLRWVRSHGEWSVAIVVIVGLLAAGFIARIQGCSIHRSDEEFDSKIEVERREIDRAEGETVQRFEQQLAELRAKNTALETEKQAALADAAKKDVKIAQLHRSRNAIQKQLEQDLRNADADISPLDRCRNACERAKQLELIPRDADCHCK